MTATPDVVGTAEVAQILNVTRQHVHNLVADGKLPVAVQVSPRVRLYDRKDVERLRDERIAWHQAEIEALQ